MESRTTGKGGRSFGLALAVSLAVVTAASCSAKLEASPAKTTSLTPSRSAPAQPSPTPITTPWISPKPTVGVGPIVPTVLATIPCDSGAGSLDEPYVKDGLLYVDCAHDLMVIDLQTRELLNTYADVFEDISVDCGDVLCAGASWTMAVAGGAIWIGDNDVKRIDPDTGAITLRLKGYELVGEAKGYLWAFAPKDSPLKLAKIDPRTGKIVGHVAAVKGAVKGYAQLSVDCDAIWEWGVDTKSTLFEATVAEIGLDGRVLWSDQTFRAYDTYVANLGGGCWVSTSDQMVRIGQSCADGHLQMLPNGVFPIGQTLWTWIDNDFDASGTQHWDMQRVDPKTWQRVGPVWRLTYGGPSYTGDGQLWVQGSGPAGQDENIELLDVPMDPMPFTPNCGPVPSLEPLPHSSASPSSAAS